VGVDAQPGFGAHLGQRRERRPLRDVEAAAQGLNSFSLMSTPRPNFIKKYKRSKIMKSMALDILSLNDKHSSR
jgi:hypothetical protein